MLHIKFDSLMIGVTSCRIWCGYNMSDEIELGTVQFHIVSWPNLNYYKDCTHTQIQY